MGEAAAVSGDAGARARVRVLAVSRVAPSPAPVERERVGLSFFDTPWVVLPPIQRVFLYETAAAADGGGGDGFAAAVERLKGSLAATLALYLPLAGKLVYVEETEDVVVDCAAADDADAGVAFVEAEAEDAAAEAMDVRRLAGDEAHDVAAFLALVPELDTRALPAPVLSVQATRLGGGAGLALGLSVHHAVADGRAVWQFMEAWSSAARVGSPVTKSLGAPHYRREAAIPQPDGGELARHMLKLRRARLQPAIPAGSPDVPPRRRRHSVGEAAHRRARLGGGGGRRRRQAQAGVDVRGAGGDGVGGVRPVQGARRRGRHVPDLPRRPPRAARPRRRRGVPRELREDVPGALPRRGGAPRRARAAARGAGGAGGGGGDGGGAARRDGGRVGDRAGDADPLLPHGERGGEPAVWGVRRRRLRVREAGARRARVDEPRRRDGARRRPARRRGAALGVHRPGARGRLQGAGPWLADATQCHRSNICHLALSIN
ncbi:hypothetical protein EE612_042400 [Oryza sativa]|nr:hypothetical protein EE612_042400 [Oryza sativa]